jgi:hypothetical protein
MDEWDEFPDAQQAQGNAPQAAQADDWGDFPDAEQAPRRRGQSMDLQADGSVVPTRSDYGPERQSDQWFQAAKNVVQGGAQAATGITGAVAGDVAGLGALAYDATANAILSPFRGNRASQYADPAAIRERVSRALTYQPSDPNNLTSKVLQAPGQVIGGAGDYMASWSDNPYAQDVLRAVPQAAASYLGVRAALPLKSKQGVAIPREGVPQPAPEVTPQQVAIKNATDIGVKLPPSAVGNRIGDIAEGVTGRAPLMRELSVENAKVIDAAAGKSVGIVDQALTKATIGIEKIKANKAYEAVARTGTRKTSDAYRDEIAKMDDRTGAGSFADDTSPAVENLKRIYGNKAQFEASDAVAKIRQLRTNARANFKTRDPEKMAIGHAQQKIADALDNELARHVDELGQPELAANYKAARVKLAKLNTVEQALSGANVSAKKIWQQWKRGAPLEGELLAIAKAYDNFPQVLQDAGKVAGTHPFSVVDAFVAAGGAAVNPALLATVAARPLTRKALASKAYQRRFVAPKGQKAPVKQNTVAPKPAASSAALVRDDRQRQAR